MSGSATVSHDGSRSITLPLLDQRDYLHGTTLFDYLSTNVPADADLRYRISRQIRSNTISLSPPMDSKDEPPSAELFWRIGNDNKTLGVWPLPCSGFIERMDYDESLVTSQASISNKMVQLTAPSPFSFVATVVALFKALLAHELEPLFPGQWLFTRLDVEKYPIEPSPLCLTLRQAIANRFAVATIEGSAGSHGEIYFAWMEKK